LLALQSSAFCRIFQDFRIGKHYAAQADEIGPSPADCGLRDNRQEFLPVAVGCSEKNQVGEFLFDLAGGFHPLGGPAQRIFRRLIAIRGRIQRWALNVRIVVRTACGQVHEANSEFFQQRDEAERFSEVYLCWVVSIYSESPLIWEQVSMLLG